MFSAQTRGRARKTGKLASADQPSWWRAHLSLLRSHVRILMAAIFYFLWKPRSRFFFQDGGPFSPRRPGRARKRVTPTTGHLAQLVERHLLSGGDPGSNPESSNSGFQTTWVRPALQTGRTTGRWEIGVSIPYSGASGPLWGGCRRRSAIAGAAGSLASRIHK